MLQILKIKLLVGKDQTHQAVEHDILNMIRLKHLQKMKVLKVFNSKAFYDQDDQQLLFAHLSHKLMETGQIMQWMPQLL